MPLIERIELYLEKLEVEVERRRFGVEQQVEFLQDLIELLPHVGSPLIYCEMVVKSEQGAKQFLAGELVSKLRSGQHMADGMVGWFDPILVQAMRVGEEQGIISECLKPILKSLATRKANRLGALKGFIYPAVLSMFIVALMLSLRNDVLPMVIAIVDHDLERLTLPLLLIWYMANWVTEAVIVFLLSIITLFAGLGYLLVNYTGELRLQLDRLPVFKQFAMYQAASFMRLYAILKRIDLAEVKIIDLMLETANPYMAMHLKEFRWRLNAGYKNLGDMMDTGLIEEGMLARLKVLADSDYFVDAMGVAARQLDQRFERSIHVLAKVVAAVWLALIGLALAIVVSGLLSIGLLVN